MIETLLHFLRDAVAHNQFIQGGFVLALAGGAVAYCRRLPAQGWGWLKNRFIITLTVTNDDPAFFWFAKWLSEQPYSKRARSLTVTTRRDAGGYPSTIACDTPAGRPEAHLPEIILTPAPGNHLLWHKRRPLWLVREKKEAANEGGKGGGMFNLWNQESFQLRVFGRDRTAAMEVIEEARRLAVVEREVRTSVYVYGYDSWRQVDARDPRPLSTIFLPAGVVESLLDDIKSFFTARDWYSARGIPWRRGFLFHGIPGSGKTASICALAGELKIDLYILNLSGGLSDNRLQFILSQLPPRCFVLLEDADASFDARKKSEDLDNTLTFSGLLNALDGAASREGWVIFITTNHKERLDPALIRPGRCDVHVEFDYATAEQAARMFRAWFPAAAETLGAAFGVRVESRRMSMAEVQAHLLLHKDSATGACALRPCEEMPLIQLGAEPETATA